MINKVRIIERFWYLTDDDFAVARDEIMNFEVKPLPMKMKRKTNPETAMDHICTIFADVMNSLDTVDFEARIEINRDEDCNILSIFQCFNSEEMDLEIRNSTDFDGCGIYVRELKNMSSNVYRVDLKDLSGTDEVRFRNIFRFVNDVLPVEQFI